MQNFYAPSEDFDNTTVILRGSEHHHATRSCRLRVDEIISVTDGAGKRVIAKAEDIGRESLSCTIIKDVSGVGEPSISLTVAIPLIHPSRFETAMEKCTELGARKFIPLVTARTEQGLSGRFKKDRLERIVFEAAKQSRRSWIPSIINPIKLQELLQNRNEQFFAASMDGDLAINNITGIAPGSSITLLIGPEGDFTDDEIDLMKSSGTKLFRMGGLTLRAETAVIVSTALFINSFGNKG